MNSKTCSVIVPIYNAAPFLAQCLSSIKMQTYEDLQVILVDDGSTDESAAIAQSFVNADRRFVLYQQANCGQSAARNVGLEYATGTFLVFVDADDYIDTDFVAQHIAAIKDVDYVQSGYRRVSTDGEILQHKLPIYCYQFVTPCMRMYRTDWIKKHALTFPDSMIYEDVVFSLQLWSTHPTHKVIRYIGYNYTYHSSSTTAHIHPAQQQELFKRIRAINAPWWLKQLTLLRLRLHFMAQTRLQMRSSKLPGNKSAGAISMVV